MTAAGSLPSLARTQRAVLLASTAAVTLVAWLWLAQGESSHANGAILQPQCHTAGGVAAFLSVVVMWQAMSVAMMAPTTLNWLFAYAALSTNSAPRQTLRSVLAFAAGYFCVWSAYSMAAAALQMLLQRAGSLDASGKLPSTAAGLVLIGAGAAHFTRFSRACLRHCRNPLTYFLAHWDNGPRGGFRFGIAHAAYCVGCCWLLMLTGFAMGVMNLIWMGLLTILVCIEKLSPVGERVAGMAAVLMIFWGLTLSLGISFAKI